MKLAQALRLSSNPTVAFSGAGGKTTALFQLARELAPALVTTSTHLGAWQVSLADRHFIWEPNAPLPEIETNSVTGVTLITGALHAERYAGLTPDQMESLRQLAAGHSLPLLIEADGARQKALKAPAEHEPAIPEYADIVVVSAGLAALGQPLTDESVHRAGIFAQLCESNTGALLTPHNLARVLTHPQGGLKNIPTGVRRVVLLNQADTPERQAQAGTITPALLSAFDSVIVASLAQQTIWSVHEPVAGVVLAAGEAARFGKPKQLLDYHGQPFIRKVAQTALTAGLSPVVVITGAYAEQVEAALAGLPAMIMRNDLWRDGQSTSIHAGVRALSPHTGAAAFLLADQPQVTPHVIQALVERHATQRTPIVAPLAADRRANPVLFDRDTFADLLEIRGDVGGRAIFAKHKVDYVPWHDESLLFDVDTEADYQKLLAWGVKE